MFPRLFLDASPGCLSPDMLLLTATHARAHTYAHVHTHKHTRTHTYVPMHTDARVSSRRIFHTLGAPEWQPSSVVHGHI